jgi:hypothetical protein
MKKDVMYPEGATARLGPSLHVKGEISEECIGSFARDRDNKWFAEFGCSHFTSGERHTCSLLLYAAR